MAMTEQQGPKTLYQQLTENVALKDPDHLRRWLLASGREFIIFKSSDLVRALPWPDGVEMMIQLVEAYRQERAKEVGHGTTLKSDALELDELKEVVHFVLRKIHAAEPNWQPTVETA
jgi:hypothetical protein